MNTKNKISAKQTIRKITGHIFFGEMIHSYRLSQELTQVEMAKILGISKQDLCNIEKTRKIISVKRGVEFAKSLSYPASVFVKYILDDQLYRAGIKGEVEIKQVS